MALSASRKEEGLPSAGRTAIHLCEPLPGQRVVVGVEFDTQPVAVQPLGYRADRAGAKERVEYQSGGEARATAAGRAVGVAYDLAATWALVAWVPRQFASRANPLGAGGQDRALDELRGEGGKVCAPVGGAADAPHAAGVLAVGVSDAPGGEQPPESAVCTVTPTTARTRRGRRGRPRRAAGVWYADGIKVEVVAGAAGEQQYILMGDRQAVTGLLRHRVWLCPHDAVTDDPAVALERYQQPLGGE